jgi:putative transposase
MARMPRIALPGYPLHVIQRGNNRGAVFHAEEDYCRYLDTLGQSAREHGGAVHAYVLMTNHVHLLVTPERETSLSLMMQAIGRRYVRYINSAYRRSGTLWEGRFKSAVIDSERYLLTCSRYIELNPVRAGMVAKPDEYRWSSYRANALGYHDDIITSHPLYRGLGPNGKTRQAAYRALFRSHVDEDALRLIRENTQQSTVVGDRRFQDEIRAMLKRRVIKHRHGGDRKSEQFKELSSDLTP